jgi:hypothetical protein
MKKASEGLCALSSTCTNEVKLRQAVWWFGGLVVLQWGVRGVKCVAGFLCATVSCWKGQPFELHGTDLFVL